MILTDEQFGKIEQYASVFFSLKEIALLLEVNSDDFIESASSEHSEIFKKYEAARLKSEYELRTEIVKMAKMGSPAAQIEALKIIAKNNINQL